MYTVDTLEGGSIGVLTTHPNVTMGSVFSQTNDVGLLIPTAETRVAKTLVENQTFKGTNASTGWMINFRAKMDAAMANETVEVQMAPVFGYPSTDVPFNQIPAMLTQIRSVKVNYDLAGQVDGGSQSEEMTKLYWANELHVEVPTLELILASCPSQDTIDVVQAMVDGIGTGEWTYFTFWFSQNKESQANTYYKIFINQGFNGAVRDSQGETIGNCPWIIPLTFSGSNVSIGGNIGSYINGENVSIPFIGEIKDIGVFNQSFVFSQISWLNRELSERF